MELIANPNANYRFLAGIAPFSAGVIADAGYEIVHAVFHRPPPYRAGFERISAHLEREGRPKDALCAIELRLPQPLTYAGFDEFNAEYLKLLEDWKLYVGNLNPIARTTVAPEMVLPPEPSLYAFSYTRPADTSRATFVVAGAGEVAQFNPTSQQIVRPGETSTDAMREKAGCVMGRMEDRLRGLGVGWGEVCVVDIYTVQALETYVQDAILAPLSTTAVHGFHWHHARPPIIGIEIEMDVRGVVTELYLG